MSKRPLSPIDRVDGSEKPFGARASFLAGPTRSGTEIPAAVRIGPQDGRRDEEAVTGWTAAPPPSSDRNLIEAAKREHAMYDRRIARLGRELACDTAWNMLIDLLICEDAGQNLSVMAVSIGSRAAPATAIRYIALLEAEGVVQRTRDRSDRRRTFVRLTPCGRAAVLEVLECR